MASSLEGLKMADIVIEGDHLNAMWAVIAERIANENVDLVEEMTPIDKAKMVRGIWWRLKGIDDYDTALIELTEKYSTTVES